MLSAVATAPGSVSSAAASGLIAAHLSFDTALTAPGTHYYR